MISEEESEKIAEFRSIIPADLLTKERFEDDHYLIRWLRARHLNLEKALEMLKRSMKWRAENRVDGILERGEEIPEKYRKLYPAGFLGTDYEGSAAFIFPLGRYRHRIVLESEGMEVALRHNIIWMEKMMKLVKKIEEENGVKGLQLVEVVDMEHYSFKDLAHGPAREFILYANKQFDEHYPEMLKTLLIINTPSLFTILYKMVKPVLSKDTLSKISIYGGGSTQGDQAWKQVIQSRLDLKRVPARWGGVRQGSDEFCSDDPEVWLDAPIPLSFFTNKQTGTVIDGFICERVPARDKLEIDLLLDSSKYSDKSNIELHWKYKVEHHNIGFTIIFHPNKLTTDDHKGNDKEAIIILPECRTDSSQGVQEGVHRCNSRNGIFTLIFDNRYSYTRSKTVHYCVELK